MKYKSSIITNLNNIPNDCEELILDNTLSLYLTNVPLSCSKIILQKESFTQLKYLKKIPFGCKVEIKMDDYFNNFQFVNYEEFLDIIKNFGYLIKINSCDKLGRTILMVFCYMCKIEIVEFLINKFGLLCIPQSISSDNETALFYCVNSRGQKKYVKKITELLIDNFGELCVPGHVDNFGDTVLFVAYYSKYSEIVKLLLKKFGKLCVPTDPKKLSLVISICTEYLDNNEMNKLLN